MQLDHCSPSNQVNRITLFTYHFAFRMVERFDDIADMYKIDKITNFEEQHFPSAITLSKVVSVWAHAGRYYFSSMMQM